MADASLTLGTLFTANIDDVINKVNQLKQAMAGLNSQFSSSSKQASSSFSQMSSSAQKASSSMRTAYTAMGRLSQQTTILHAALGNLNRAFRVVATYGVASAVIYGLINAFKSGAQEIVDYDQALKNLQAITRSTDAEVASMGETIKDVAAKTKFSTGEVASGMVLLGQAGFTASEAINSMAAVADLATGTLSDMKLVTDLLTTVVRAFNLSTIESTRVADVMANAINRSKLTVDKLRVAFNFVGAAASQTGLTIEQTAAAMGVLANNGIRASTIGTGLRQVLARLLAPSRKLREAFQEQGISLDSVNPRIVGFEKSMERLASVLIDTERNVVDMGKTYELFGLRGAQAAAILIKEFVSGGYQQMLRNVNETGTAADMAATQMEGLGVKIKNLADRAKLVAVAFGEAGVTGAFKIFIDLLRELALIIAELVSTGLGRFAVTVGILGVAFGSLNAVMKLSAALFGILMGRARTLTAAWYTLAAANPWIGLAAAIGVLVGTVGHYVREARKAIDEEENIIQKNSQAAESYKIYAAALRKLAKDRDEGKKIELEYERVINRLSKEYPELAGSIDKSTDSLESNIRALDNAYGKKNQENIEKITKLIKDYQEEIQRTRFLEGLWEGLSDLGDAIVNSFIGFVQRQLETIDRIVVDVRTGLTSIRDFVLSIPIIGDLLAGSLEAISKWFGESYGYFEELGSKSKDLEEIIQRQTDAYKRLALTMKDQGSSLDEIKAKLVELGASSKNIDEVTKALEEQKIGISDLGNKYKKELDTLPDLFIKFYDTLDPLRQADLAKVQDTIDKEIAAYKKRAEIVGHTYEQQAAAEAGIRARHLIGFYEDMEKEVKGEEDLQQRKIEIIRAFINQAQTLYDRDTKNILNNYIQRRTSAELSAQEIVELEANKNQALIEAEQTYQATVLGIKAAFHEDLIEQQKELAKEMNKVHEDLASDLVSQLKERYNDLEKETDKLVDDLSNLESKYHDDLKDLRQQTMTEEEKWYDDRRELDETLIKARATGDKDLYDKARELAKSLSKEVKDEHGNTVKSLEETNSEALYIMGNIYREESILLKKQADQNRVDMANIQRDMENLTKLIEDYRKEVDAVARKKLELQTDEAISRMNSTYNITTRFKDVWDQLKSKTITLTIEFQTKGKAPEGTPFDTGPEPVPGFQSGTVLPGFGGGDKVKAFLEAGEAIIRKEVVSKYGKNFFQALNNMSLSYKDIVASLFKKRNVSVPKSSGNRFQVGGFVSGQSSEGLLTKYRNLTINIYPPDPINGEMGVKKLVRKLTTELKSEERREGLVRRSLAYG